MRVYKLLLGQVNTIFATMNAVSVVSIELKLVCKPAAQWPQLVHTCFLEITFVIAIRACVCLQAIENIHMN